MSEAVASRPTLTMHQDTVGKKVCLNSIVDSPAGNETYHKQKPKIAAELCVAAIPTICDNSDGKWGELRPIVYVYTVCIFSRMRSNVSVTLGDDRFIRVGDQPYFPIIARHIPDGADYRMLHEIGFNAVRWPVVNLPVVAQESRDPPTIDDLAGMMFCAYVYNLGDLSNDTAARRRSELSRAVEQIRDRSDLLCYEQFNEPAYAWPDLATPRVSPEGMLAGSRLIREMDPGRPIRVGHMCSNLVSTLRRYNPAVDIVGCNPYVIDAPDSRRFVGTRPDGYLTDHPDRTLSAVGRYTEKMMRVAQGRAVWMQLQASSNENWYSGEHTPEARNQGIYEHHRLYPNYWQMRFMAYHAIIHGATGLEWFLYRHPVDAPSFLDVRKMIGELREMHDVLASPTVKHEFEIEYEELGFSDWEGVETLVKRHDGRTYILAANTQFDPMIATFLSVPKGIGSRLGVVTEGRKIAVESGRFKDRFQPYEVHVYASE